MNQQHSNLIERDGTKLLPLIIALMAILTLGCIGKNGQVGKFEFQFDEQALDTFVEHCEPCGAPEITVSDVSQPPCSSVTTLPESFRHLTLDEAIQISLNNETIIRSLGGRVLDNPDAARTRYDIAIQDSNPISGREGALSDFDTQFQSGMNYANNDDVFNNFLAGGGANEIQQDLYVWDTTLSKTTATGTQFSLRSQLQHDNNNSPSNLFDNVWTTNLEASARIPLMQGRGLEFNRIAGPNAQPGFRFSNGIIIAQINDEISIADFERAMINHISEVINSYWTLSLAYQTYDELKKSRDNAKEIWQVVNARYENDLSGGEQDKEAQAREVFFQFQQDLLAALNGDTRNGRNGILQAESNLRRIMGLPQSDDCLLRPSEEPFTGKIIEDWQALCAEALGNRVELWQQLQRTRRREAELIASKNFLLPRFDAVLTYRNNGFGDDLIGGGAGQFASAIKDAASGQHDEWELGLQYNVPIGNRRAHEGVRHAELNLRREQVILGEMKEEIIFELGNAVRAKHHAQEAVTLAYNRYDAAKETVESQTAVFDEELIPLDQLLDSQRRLVDATLNYRQALVDHTLAIVDLQRASGELLDFYRISLSPGITADAVCEPQ